MKVNSSPDKILVVSPRNADWLQATFPTHYTELQRMIKKGDAVVSADAPEVKAA